MLCEMIFTISCAIERPNQERGFLWSEDAHVAFDKMKKVMITFLVLALPYFTLPFVVECDTFGEAI
jgi:hypothetical protein